MRVAVSSSFFEARWHLSLSGGSIIDSGQMGLFPASGLNALHRQSILPKTVLSIQSGISIATFGGLIYECRLRSESQLHGLFYCSSG